jgi:hypothetical protein
MKQYEIRQGNRLVVICEDSESRVRFSARLYLNNGETVSLQSWKGTTKKGAETWAKRMLSAL